MSTTLYGSTSTAALVVHWLLIELGIEHELVLLDFDAREHKSAEYLALNPAGVVPTLLIDGLVLTEAAAIALYLADRHPDAGLLPALGTPQRADAYRWMFWCANTLQPAYRAWFYPHEVAGEATWRPVARWRGSAWKRPGSMWPRTCWRMALPAGRHALRGRLHAGDADALVAQHAQAQ
jgi:glutathione S-transferase